MSTSTDVLSDLQGMTGYKNRQTDKESSFSSFLQFAGQGRLAESTSAARSTHPFVI
jgi:hypothetical protein